MQDQIDKIGDDVRQIKDALLGNEFGNEGIVNRLKTVEKKTVCNKKAISSSKNHSLLYGTGAGGVLVGIVEAIKAYFSH